MSLEILPLATQYPRGDTILIVEDDADLGAFLQQLINDETPYHAVTLSDGQEALERAPDLHPCLLLLDYHLPGLNGLELYDRLQHTPETGGIPAIMMSANLPRNELEQRGIFQLRKPMDIRGVIRVITHALATTEERRLHI